MRNSSASCLRTPSVNSEPHQQSPSTICICSVCLLLRKSPHLRRSRRSSAQSCGVLRSLSHVAPSTFALVREPTEPPNSKESICRRVGWPEGRALPLLRCLTTSAHHQHSTLYKRYAPLRPHLPRRRACDPGSQVGLELTGDHPLRLRRQLPSLRVGRCVLRQPAIVIYVVPWLKNNEECVPQQVWC